MQVSYFLLLLLLTAVVVGFTRPSSLIRLSSLPLAVLCAWQCLSPAAGSTARSTWDSLLGGYCCTFLLHHFDIAILCQWTFDRDGPVVDMAQPVSRQQITTSSQTRTVKRGGGTVWERLKYGLNITFSARLIGTPSQVRYLVPFSKAHPTYVPSRTRFLFKAAGTIVLCCLLLDISNPAAEQEINQKYLTVQNISLFKRFGRVSLAEIAIRAIAGIGACCCAVCAQNVLYNFAAFWAVLLGLSEPKDWPPLFGSFYDAYSVRRLWSVCWHQTNTHKYSATSNFIVHRVLMVPPGRTTISRYLRVVVIFAVSGALHMAVDFSMGVPLRNSGGFRFFCTQIIGIVIEDAVLGIYRKFSHRPNQLQPSIVHKGIGFVWVCCFLVWSYPAYMFPIIEQTANDPAFADNTIVPFKIGSLLKKIID